jgi:uncharacterized protein with PQ loop repeat
MYVIYTYITECIHTHTHKMENYPVINKNEILLPAGKGICLKDVMLSEVKKKLTWQ